MTTLSRRTFLSGSATTTIAWSAAVRAAGSPTLTLVPVAEGLFVSPGRHELFTPENQGHISNITVIVGDEAVAVIDTGGSAANGRSLIEAVRTITGRPIGYVINTHMHPDHVFGNAPLAGGRTEFVGHTKLPRALATRADRYLTANRDSLGPDAFEGTRIITPTRLVTDSIRIDLGGRTLRLDARKTAHTDNDLTVLDEKTNTIILGDLLFSEHIPTLDGSIKGWLAQLDALEREPAARAIPGHGPPVMAWPDALAAERRYLTAVVHGVRQTIRSGGTLSDAVATVARSNADGWLLFDDFHARNVSAAFAELEWE
jgi:quinoprotein relay system zinc metallohydrolase 2